MPPKVNTELVEAREGLATLQEKLNQAAQEFEAGDNKWSAVQVWGAGSEEEKRATMREKQAEANALGEKIDRIIGDQQMMELARRNNARLEANDNPGQAATDRLAGVAQNLTLGANFVNALRQANLMADGGNAIPQTHGQVRLPGALNALFRTQAGAPPPTPRLPGVIIPTAEDVLTIRDLMPIVPTTIYSQEFLRESVFEGDAGVVTEPATASEPEVPGATGIGALAGAQETARTAARGYAPELRIELTEVTTEMDDIMAFLPVTERQLRAVPEIEDFITMRGDRKMAEAVDEHLINGNEPNNIGFLRYATGNAHNQFQNEDKVTATNAPNNLMTMLRGIRLLREKNGVVTAMLMPPALWEHTLSQAIDSGRYPLGNPTDMPGDRFWGIRAVLSSRFPTGQEATVLMGDFAGEAAIAMMDDIFSETSSGYLDYFRRALLAIRFRATLGLRIYTPQLFITLTGLDLT